MLISGVKVLRDLFRRASERTADVLTLQLANVVVRIEQSADMEILEIIEIL